MSGIEKILQIRPGKVAALFPPIIAASEPDAAAEASIRDAICFAQKNGVKLLQSLVHPGNEQAARWLTSCGFSHVSEVLYLVCRKFKALATDVPSKLQFVALDETSEMQNRLSDLVLCTYEGSLDCPQLNGVRFVDDVLASYRAVGRYNPQRWLIAERENAGVGCILLAEHPEQRELEIVYMGVVPEFRGQRFGFELVRHAQILARNASVERLSLAVDAKNRPALSIYFAAGFEVAVKHRLFLQQI
jgi:ribosomal protein S18 acetylase RimI-like enzyme